MQNLDLKNVYENMDFSSDDAPPSPSASSESSNGETEETYAREMAHTTKAVNDILNTAKELSGGGKKKKKKSSATKKKATPKAKRKSATAVKTRKTKRKIKGGSGTKRDMSNSPFMRPHLISPELQQVVQQTHLPRPHVVRELWKYIKGANPSGKNLQDPSNMRNIKCDAALKAVFGQSEINMFAMQKKLSEHLTKTS